MLHFNKKAAYALSKVPVLGNIVKIVTFRDFEDNTGEMSASVRVPEVKVTGKDQKADEDASKKLNAQIKKYTDKIIDEYWKDVKETKGKGRENVTIDYEVVTNTKRLFSLKINSSVQINTSSDEAKVYHIDKKTGKCMLRRIHIFALRYMYYIWKRGRSRSFAERTGKQFKFWKNSGR